MSSVVDTSALIALARDEPGAHAVAEHLRRGGMLASTVVTETIVVLQRLGWSYTDAAAFVDGFELLVLPTDRQIATKAASFESVVRTLELSLGDRICIATALVAEMPLLTCDQVWSELPKHGIDVEVVVAY